MTQQVALLSARTTDDMVSEINTFFAAQPLTLVVQELTILAHDLARFTGIEYRCEIAYDDTAGTALASPLTVEAYVDNQLPVLEQDVNAAIAAAPSEMWYPLPLMVADSARRLNQNVAWFLRNPSPTAAENIQQGSEASPKITSIVAADSPYTATAGETIFCNATAGAITVNYPPAAAFGAAEISVIKTDASANAVTLDPNGAETINGAASDSLAAQYNAITAISNGVALFIKSEM